MTGDKALLSQFEEKAGPLVTFGDNSKGFTMGCGKIVSENVVIEDVALVAGLEKTGEVALKGARKGSLFVADLDSTNMDGICCFYTKALEEQSKLWHKKLSHLNFKTINTLVKKELVRDMPKLEFAQVEVCEACQKGKMKRSSHKSKNSTLSEFCKSKGIVQEFSAARTYQQNGVVERKNRTLVEAARTILQDAKLPTSFWEEAVNIACYTQNRYLINKAHGKSPYSIMSKRNPTVKHLHVLRSKCYILKENSKYVGKFDSKKIMENTDVTLDDDKCPGLECLDDNEAEALAFENLNIDSDSDGEDEFNAQRMINEETTQQENHESGSSSQTPKFDSTNSGGEIEEGSSIEPKKIDEALQDPDWISAMQEELNQFERNEVWELVPAPKNRSIIGTKWVFRNKMDENRIVTRNKARLVAKGYSQEEGIDCDETFAPVTS
ncbi:hypothetical protein AgCh_009938 [Apium graveolens]